MGAFRRRHTWMPAGQVRRNGFRRPARAAALTSASLRGDATGRVRSFGLGPRGDGDGVGTSPSKVAFQSQTSLSREGLTHTTFLFN